MAYPKAIEDIEGKAKVTLSATVGRGDVVGYSSGWKLSDSDAAAYIFAQYVALQSGVSGEEIRVCRGCTFYDEDAPYTADAPYYASGTAGSITTIRPASDGDLIQVIGRGLSTKRVRVEISAPKEWEMFLSPDVLDTSSEPGLGTSDAGWPGPALTAVETCRFKGRFPSGIVGSLSAAKIVFDSINASAGDIDITVVAAYDGASNVQDTGAPITTGDWTQSDADNIMLTMDISSALDAGFYKPARSFAIFVDPDGITAEALVVGLYLRGWKV